MKEIGVLNRSIPVTFAILRESTLDPTFCLILKLKEETLLQLHLSVDIIIMTADILKEVIPYRLEHFDNKYIACVIISFFLFL